MEIIKIKAKIYVDRVEKKYYKVAMDNEMVNYRKYLPKILRYATKYYGTDRCKGQLCKDANISPQRWSDLEKGIKKTTAYYIFALMGALTLDITNIEEVLRLKFSIEERKKLRYQQYMLNHEEFFIKLMDRPLLLRHFEEILESTENSENTDNPK